jgi:hypothetical protein
VLAAFNLSPRPLQHSLCPRAPFTPPEIASLAVHDQRRVSLPFATRPQIASPDRSTQLRASPSLTRASDAMCRLLVVKSNDPIQLSQLITAPAHSIINQASDSRLRLDSGYAGNMGRCKGRTRELIWLEQLNQCGWIWSRILSQRTGRDDTSWTLHLSLNHSCVEQPKPASPGRTSQVASGVCACPSCKYALLTARPFC